MRYLVASAPDNAALNLRDRLSELAQWAPVGEFQESPVWELTANPLGTSAAEEGPTRQGQPLAVAGQMRMVTLNGWHLYADHLGATLVEAGQPEPELLCFLSRHQAASGRHSLTVHPVGNYGAAEYGGAEATLAVSAPRWMTGALRTLKQEAEQAGLDHLVGYEVTHHGPELSTPAFFIEIGSDETQWPRPEPAQAIARALLKARAASRPVLVGVGGGHYAPRHSDVALGCVAAMGHMVPGYALKECAEAEQVQRLRAAWAKTPEAEALYFHRKGLPKPIYRQLRAWAQEEGLKVVSSRDLEPLIT